MQCRGCATPNAPTARFCRGCGQPLVASNACGSCGQANAADARFCLACGSPLVEASLSGRPCPACGQGNGPAARFCLACGSPLATPLPDSQQPPPAVLPCPACGQGNASGARFCLACGQPLAQEPPSPPAQGSSPFDRLVGQTLAGYRIERKLGEGGMGAVFLATHLRLQRPVACKLLPQQLSNDRRLIERFEREARVLAKVVHPGIISIHDMLELAGHYCIVMAYAEGGSLGARLARQGPLPSEQVAELGAQAARALVAAARKGIVHRDIKPDNLLLTAEGRLLVADFGLARVAEEGRTLTRMGSMMGTPAFMAPEQWENSHEADHRSDLYALGCTLYALLTGRPPFPGPTTSEFIRQHLLEAPPPPSQLRDDLPVSIERVILKLLAKDPGERYPDGEALAVALDSCLTAPPLPRGLEDLFAEPEDAEAALTAEAPEPPPPPAGPPPLPAACAPESTAPDVAPPSRGGWACCLFGMVVPFAVAIGIFHEELLELLRGNL